MTRASTCHRICAKARTTRSWLYQHQYHSRHPPGPHLPAPLLHYVSQPPLSVATANLALRRPIVSVCHIAALLPNPSPGSCGGPRSLKNLGRGCQPPWCATWTTQCGPSGEASVHRLHVQRWRYLKSTIGNVFGPVTALPTLKPKIQAQASHLKPTHAVRLGAVARAVPLNTVCPNAWRPQL